MTNMMTVIFSHFKHSYTSKTSLLFGDFLSRHVVGNVLINHIKLINETDDREGVLRACSIQGLFQDSTGNFDWRIYFIYILNLYITQKENAS